MPAIICPNVGAPYLKDGERIIPLPPTMTPEESAMLLAAYLQMKREGELDNFPIKVNIFIHFREDAFPREN